MRILSITLLVLSLASTLFAQAPMEVKQPLSKWESYYKNATVGDYTVYETGGTTSRKEVVEVGDHKVTIVTTRGEEKVRETLVFTGPERPVGKSRYEEKVSRESVKIGDRAVDCERTDSFNPTGAQPDKPVTSVWKSTQVPFEGTVKTESRMNTGTTLTEFKYAKAPK